MKHRTLPFGYEIQNGIVQINKAETQAVTWIFTEYLNGSNLKEIAESLTIQRTEYMPDKYDWNKNRIKRIIEDRRYTGDGKYPKIISQRMFEQANAVKEEKRTTKSYMVDASNKPLVYAVRCSYCGKTMIHNTNRKAKYTQQWDCGTENCGTKIYMTIEQIEQAVTKLMNEIIRNPILAEQQADEQDMPTEISIMESEINRMLEQTDLDKNEIQNKILECAAKKYEYCTDKAHITERLKADFEKTSPLSDFSMDIFTRTVSAVLIDESNKTRIVLKNGNIITEKSDEIGSDSTEKESQGNPCQARIFGQKYP